MSALLHPLANIVCLVIVAASAGAAFMVLSGRSVDDFFDR